MANARVAHGDYKPKKKALGLREGLFTFLSW
jgi:hypothetical protein